ncbi:MAG: MBL fold metallo-hydrolase [Roseiflexaceae bacterium]
MVIPIRLRLSNAYLVKGERPILVDTGSPGETDRIVQALHAEGVAPGDLALILHTHGHYDHCGSSAALRKQSGAPTAIHPADAPLMASGRTRDLKATRRSAALLAPLMNQTFDALQADLLVGPDTDLRPYGVAGRLLHTPGHTHGSLTLLLDSGEAIVGDLLMGGHLGGVISPQQPRYHYFADDIGLVRTHIGTVVRAAKGRVYVGHGGPLELDAIRTSFQSIL